MFVIWSLILVTSLFSAFWNYTVLTFELCAEVNVVKIALKCTEVMWSKCRKMYFWTNENCGQGQSKASDLGARWRQDRIGKWLVINCVLSILTCLLALRHMHTPKSTIYFGINYSRTLNLLIDIMSRYTAIKWNWERMDETGNDRNDSYFTYILLAVKQWYYYGAFVISAGKSAADTNIFTLGTFLCKTISLWWSQCLKRTCGFVENT